MSLGRDVIQSLREIAGESLGYVSRFSRTSKRTCLRCGRLFWSSGKGNRRCPQCVRHPAKANDRAVQG